MYKYLLLVLLTLSITPVHAGLLFDLSKEPASRYELGKLKLEHIAYKLSVKYRGEEVGRTNYYIKGFSVEEYKILVLSVSVVGRTKDISDELCKKMVKPIRDEINFSDISSSLWRGLTDEQKDLLKQELLFKVILVSKENDSFRKECT
ncbi:MAG: hypothetical protein ABW105_03455 [Candidatus Thiodiazotropha sp. 6PLUC1]